MELFKIKMSQRRIKVTCKLRTTVIKQLHHLQSKSANFRVYSANHEVGRKLRKCCSVSQWKYVSCKRNKFSVASKLREKEIAMAEKINRHVGVSAEGYEDQHRGYELGIRREEEQRILEFSAAMNMSEECQLHPFLYGPGLSIVVCL